MFKRKMVLALIDWTSEWNSEIHNAIEAKVQQEYRRQFPTGTKDADAIIANMRTFYYGRMSNTANLLVGIVAVLVAFVALIVSVAALFHG
ncbi:hypothetical protein [Burkholderia glumae]|uniref:hypothetical protein n=1 Tax=Burkholderia glumae TaxID=337 RepID=UPI002151CDB3|nr:hypothetical protein [Burkholderia glumae]